jgi:hypothetical protein
MEITPKEIAILIFKKWRTIILFVLATLIFLIATIFTTSKQYESILLIKLGQVESNEITNSSKINEDNAKTIIAITTLPNFYDSETKEICGIEKDGNISFKKNKITLISTYPNIIIEIRVKDSSEEKVENCNLAIYKLIKLFQDKNLENYLRSIKNNQLIDDFLFTKIEALLKNTTVKDQNNAENLIQTYIILQKLYKNENLSISETKKISPLYVQNLSRNNVQILNLLFTSLIIGSLLGVIYILVIKFNRE